MSFGKPKNCGKFSHGLGEGVEVLQDNSANGPVKIGISLLYLYLNY
jgi:hypothetical protein